MYKKIITASLLFMFSIASAHALECKFVAYKIDSVVRYADTGKVVNTINDLNAKLEEMIRLCGKKPHPMHEAQIPKVDIYNPKANKKNCTQGIVSKQAENAQRAVGVQVGRVRDAANTASANTDLLASMLMECIKNK